MSVSPEILVQLRKERAWSQEKLATMCGLSERTIQRVERDGTCSLETKLALANVFSISPDELAVTQTSQGDNVEYRTHWGGILGLFILGLSVPLLAIWTAQNGMWELISFSIVIGFTLLLSFMNYGVRATYRIFDKTSWLVRSPSYVADLVLLIPQAASTIQYAYIVGLVASASTALLILAHFPSMLDQPIEYFMLSVRPLFYAVLFVELWFRPYKKKLESMLLKQNQAKMEKTFK